MNHRGNAVEASWRSGYAADCKSVYTGSIPVLASNIFNDLRHVVAPLARFLKQVLKHSRFLPVLFKAVSGVLRPCCEFPLPDLTSVFFEHLDAGMTGDGFHHLVVASG
jgi:hypothetical protein